jgi:hypothetical protein
MLSGDAGARSMANGIDEHEYYVAGQFDRSYKLLPLIDGRFSEVRASFVSSFDRIAALYDLPIQLVYWSAHIARSGLQARARLGWSPEENVVDSDPQFIPIALQIMRETAAGPAEVWEFGARYMSLVSASEGKWVADGIEAALAAMVTSGYAGLETLAADLWVEAANQNADVASNWIKENADRHVPLNVLAGYNYSVADKMGTVLRNTRKVTFESWGDIRKAYKHAFKGDVDEAFEPWRPLYLAEKTRHLFAHRGGMIDRKFADEMKEHFPSEQLEVGRRLRLTGPIVRDHLNACVTTGSKLMMTVNSWMTEHE